MPDQRLDPKRERWINAAFVLVTVAIAVVLFAIAANFALDQDESSTNQSPNKTAQQSDER